MTDKIMKKRARDGRECRFCGNTRGMVRKYGLYMCRQCFKDRAASIGFKRYS